MPYRTIASLGFDFASGVFRAGCDTDTACPRCRVGCQITAAVQWDYSFLASDDDDADDFHMQRDLSTQPKTYSWKKETNRQRNLFLKIHTNTNSLLPEPRLSV